ncbi:MAG: class I SAM-dependent methyltransferase [Ornithinibacter sp.]
MADDVAPPSAWDAFGAAYQGWQLVQRLVVGERSGLLAALCAGPGTAEEIADRAGTDPRLTLEWLRVMTVGGLSDVRDRTFTARPGLNQLHRVPEVDSPVGIVSEALDRLPALVDALSTAVRTGGGVAPEVYGSAPTRMQNLFSTMDTAPHLVPDLLTPVDGLVERLEQGCRVLEVGCGAGWALETLADAFPAPTFTGVDLDELALVMAGRRLRRFGDRVVVEVRDVMHVAPGSADVVLAMDVVHDLPDPLGALVAVRRALSPDGVLLVTEAEATGDFEVDRHGPMGWQYSPSFSRCIPVSQYAGGEGLGAMWGQQAAADLMHRAGFARVDTHTTSVHSTVFACRR